MRQVAIALILINFLALATGSAHVLAQTPAGIRPGDGVGPVRLGMSPAEVQAALGGPPSERYSNGWWLWANQKIDVYFYQGRALMIDTESPEILEMNPRRERYHSVLLQVQLLEIGKLTKAFRE